MTMMSINTIVSAKVKYNLKGIGQPTQHTDYQQIFGPCADLFPAKSPENPPLEPDTKFDTHSRRGTINFSQHIQ
jgi:hypothetical protein